MKIELKGIKRNTPGVISEDGELEELVNLRYKDGAFRPIPNRSVILPELNYTDIYIHSNSGYKHYLGVREDKLYYFAKDIASEATKHTEIEICNISGEVTFTQMGNVINILDSQGIKYAVWYDDGYKLIDSNFDGEQNSEELLGKVDLKVDVNPEGRAYTGPFSLDDKIQRESFLSTYTRSNAIEKQDGRLNGIVLACSAIELYDGSYILHSNPILLGCAADDMTRYESLFVNGVKKNYLTDKIAAFGISAGDLSVKDEYYTTTQSETIVVGDVNPSTPQKIPYLPNLVMRFPVPNYSEPYPTRVYRSCNDLKYKVNSKLSPTLEPLIKSISVFITTQIDMYKEELEVNTFDKQKLLGDSTYYKFHYLKLKTNSELKKEIGELSTFYKIHEIPFEQLVEGSPAIDWTVVDLKDKLLKLTSQEVLTYDNFSHHQLLPEVQFMYNSKLHLGDMKTFLSRGFPLGNFFTEQGVGQFPNERGIIGGLAYWIEVSIKTGSGLTKVVRYKNRAIGNVNVSDIASFVSYPDARATKMVIHIEYAPHLGVDGVTKDFEFKLTAHTTQNFAYYVSNDLKAQSGTLGIDPLQPAFTHPLEVQREQINSNVCRVSEINNPFVFPVENTYSIGNGEIKAFSTNTIELSVGQAGQFPLYIFTSDGIYALFIGGAEVNYASSRPISREVINNKNVKPVDNGVIFTTDKGVMIISGSQVQDLSEALRGDFLDISNQTTFQKTKSGLTMLQEVVANDKLVQLSTAITTENVLEFIKNAVVGYKYIDKEIWFTNPDKDYSYIFSKGLWTKITQTGTRFINDYPRQLILNGSNLVDIAGETTGYVQTMFITRPLKMGDGFKQMITAVVRGDFKTNATLQHHAGIYIFGSYDGKRWNFLGGHEAKGELKDLGAKVERTDCKYFRIAFVGNISTDSTINYIEIEGKESLLNKKIR